MEQPKSQQAKDTEGFEKVPAKRKILTKAIPPSKIQRALTPVITSKNWKPLRINNKKKE
jgi:hypothetical protein